MGQAGLLLFGSIWMFAATGISAEWNFILIRMMIGCAGATFVTNQFWCSLMFAPKVVGTANATAAGWGNLGGGVTQIFIVWCLFKPFKAAGANANVAWRLSMVVPGVIFVLIALGMKLICWDTPTNRRFKTSDTGKTSKASLWDYVECLKDIRIDIMILQYGKIGGDKSPTDCEDVPDDVWAVNCKGVVPPTNCTRIATLTNDPDSCPEKCRKYNFQILPKCVCAPGTHCRNTILYSSITSVGITIFVRVALGTLLERFGPVNVQSGLMSFGAIWVVAAAGISAEWNFILIRMMIGCAGATFVTNQFWCSLMFAPKVV